MRVHSSARCFVFDCSAVYLWCSIAFCRKINCSPFLLNKPLVNITETAGEFFFHNPVKSFHGRDPDADGCRSLMAPKLQLWMPPRQARPGACGSGRGAPEASELHVKGCLPFQFPSNAEKVDNKRDVPVSGPVSANFG